MLLILLICLTWGFIVLFGPMVLKYVIENHFDNTIKLENVKVSPKLELYIGKVTHQPTIEQNRATSKTTLKAVTLKLLPLSSGELKFLATAGPSNMENRGSISGLSLEMMPRSIFNWQSQNLLLDLTDLETLFGHRAEKLLLNGTINLRNSVLVPLNFDAFNFSSQNNNFNVEKMSGGFERFDLQKSLYSQLDKAKIDFRKINLAVSETKVNAAQASVRESNGELKFSALLQDTNILDGKYSSPVGNLDATINLAAGNNKHSVDIELDQLVSKDNSLGYMKADNGEDIHVGGHIEKGLLEYNDQFIADLSDVQFESKISVLNKPNDLAVSSDVKVSFNALPKIALTTKASFNMSGSSVLSSCTELSCELEDIKIEYSLIAGSEQISGLVDCELANCKNFTGLYTVHTRNLTKFFEQLSIPALINPLFSLLAYNFILSGEASDVGYKISVDN